MLTRILIILSLSTIGYFASFATAKEEMKMPPTLVETFQVKSRQWQQQVPATGTLVAYEGALLQAEVEGRVTKIAFKPGQTVAAGTALIEINPAAIEAQFHSAEAQLKLQEANYRRFTQLFNKKLFAKAELDKQLAALNAAKADMESAKAKLAQAKVMAPFTGKIGLNKANLGEYVKIGQDLVSLQSLDFMQIDFSLPEAYAGKLANGQAVSIKVASYPNQIFTGTLTGIDSMIDPKTRSIAGRAQIPNKEQKLLPGAFAEVTVYIGDNQAVISVPQQALVYEQGKTFIYKVVDKKAIKIAVKTGSRMGDEVIIKQGIKPNETIVVAGQLKLRDQAPVIAKPAAG